MKKMTEMYVKLSSRLQSEKGATMVEYALIVALIAAVCIIAVTGIGTSVAAKFQDVAGKL